MYRILQISLILQALIVTLPPVWAGCEFPHFGTAESARELARKKAFLRQNDRSKLVDDHCGGNCASIAITDAILILRESLRHGSIVGLSNHIWSAKPELVAIQNRILDDILTEYRNNTGKSGLNGAYLAEFKDILPLVFEQQFGKPPYPITVSPVDYSAFQSVETTNNALMVLGVSFLNKSHAVLAHSIRKADRVDKYLFGDVTFVVTVHDPLLPYQTRHLGVYEKNGLFYLMNYYSTNADRSLDVSGQGKTAASAALINDAIVIAINTSGSPTEKWDRARAKTFASDARRVKIITTSGFIFTGVRIPKNQFGLTSWKPNQKLTIVQRFSNLMSEIPYNLIHDIEFE